MSKLKDYYAKEQQKQNALSIKIESDGINQQIELVENLRKLMLDIIRDIIELAEVRKPAAISVSWKSERQLILIQKLLKFQPYKIEKSYAWDIGSNYFLTIEGRLLIRRRMSRDYDGGSYYYDETFPYHEGMDDPYSACESLIDFMEKLNADISMVSDRRNSLGVLKKQIF